MMDAFRKRCRNVYRKPNSATCNGLGGMVNVDVVMDVHHTNSSHHAGQDAVGSRGREWRADVATAG